MAAATENASVSFVRRACDILFGTVSSFLAIIVGIFIWGMLFDRAGGEPFSSTVFGALFMWPILLILIVGGPIAWWHHRTMRQRLVILGGQVLVTDAAIGLSWLIG